MNWRLAAPEVTGLLNLMRPAALVSDADCAGLAKQALAGLAGAGRPCSVWASQRRPASWQGQRGGESSRQPATRCSKFRRGPSSGCAAPSR